MRAFLAITLDPAVRSALAHWRDRLAGALGPTAARAVRWVDQDQVHLTLRFFGNLADGHASAIAASLTGPWSSGPFDLVVTGARAFPERGRPQVIWAGVDSGGAGSSAALLAALHDEVTEKLRPLSLPDPDRGRPFRPHLTVGRVRRVVPSGFARSLVSAFAAVPVPLLRSRVDRLTLIESRLSPRGSSYVELANLDLV
jgi:2'-5' RNA ligase